MRRSPAFPFRNTLQRNGEPDPRADHGEARDESEEAEPPAGPHSVSRDPLANRASCTSALGIS